MIELHGWIPALSVDAVTVFDTASGLSAQGIGKLISGITLAIISAFSLWVIVGAVRQWMRGDDDMLSVFFSVVRGVLIVVVVAALLGIDDL